MDAARVAGMPITAPRPSLVYRKVGGGGGAINHQFKRSQAPLGDVQGNIIQLHGKKKKNLICYFFPPWLDNSIPTLGGERAHHL